MSLDPAICSNSLTSGDSVFICPSSGSAPNSPYITGEPLHFIVTSMVWYRPPLTRNSELSTVVQRSGLACPDRASGDPEYIFDGAWLPHPLGSCEYWHSRR